MPNLFKVWKTKGKTIRKMNFWNLKVHVYGCVCGFVCDVIVIYEIWSYECYVNNFTHFIRMRNVSRSMKKEFYWRKMAACTLLHRQKILCTFLSTKNYLLELELICVYSWFCFRYVYNWHSRCSEFFVHTRDGSGVK